MEFKISFSPEPPVQLLNYKQPCLFTGSCFSDYTANHFSKHYFNVVAQPNGVVFNPLSIAKHLTRIFNRESYRDEDLRMYNELWHSWDHHSSFSAIKKETALEKMNASLLKASDLLSDENAVLFITLGSAFVYEWKEGNEIVANCHKYPQSLFNKRLLTVEEVVHAFEPVIGKFNGMIYFTVSPVRHIRDGLAENNLSKAILLQAVHSLCSNAGNCYYFPAYEIVIDELRDYRFYHADMVHPNEQASLYVWQQLVKTCMDKETIEFVKDAGVLQAMQQHKIMHPGSASHQKHVLQQKEKVKKMNEKYGTFISV